MQTQARHNRVIEKLLPWGTRRHYFYELMLIGITILRNEGWRSFSSKVVRTLKRHMPFRIGDPYPAWIRKNEPDAEALERQRQESLSFHYRPRISVVTPVWNTSEKWLRCAIESVINQTYDNWELCLADGGSTKPYVKGILEEYAEKDVRIKVKFLPENKGIAVNSNEALSMATGEFIALLDHDDELAPFALYECVKLLNEIPETDFIYSDEDRITHKGRRFKPFFKSDWSPDMFLSYMYTHHMGLYRKTIADEIGAFRTGYDGAELYDFVLRFIEKAGCIEHTPKVLYHGRSTAGTSVFGKKALGDYLSRNAIKGKVLDGLWTGSYRMKREIIGRPLVSIIVPSKDNVDISKNCIESILEKTEYSHYEILIVDNQSIELATHDYYEQIAANKKIRILHYDRPFNFSILNNWAVRQASGEYLLLLNNDTEVISPEWLTAMLEHSQRPEVGVVGAKLLFPDGTIENCGFALGLGADVITGQVLYRYPGDTHYPGRANVICNYSAVTGACLMVRKQLYEELGGLDENMPYNYNDTDLCLRAWEKGYRIVYTPYARLYHLESYTRGHPDTLERRRISLQETEYFLRKWGSLVEKGDSYYRTNMTNT